MVSFGIRGGSYVVGTVTADEVQDADNPFQNLISGAGWLVRAGVNHVEASARDGHLDILRNTGSGGGGGGETSGDSSGDIGDDDEAGAEGGGWLEDVLVAKLARTAIGHDSEGRLILLQVRGGVMRQAAVRARAPGGGVPMGRTELSFFLKEGEGCAERGRVGVSELRQRFV